MTKIEKKKLINKELGTKYKDLKDLNHGELDRIIDTITSNPSTNPKKRKKTSTKENTGTKKQSSTGDNEEGEEEEETTTKQQTKKKTTISEKVPVPEEVDTETDTDTDTDAEAEAEAIEEGKSEYETMMSKFSGSETDTSKDESLFKQDEKKPFVSVQDESRTERRGRPKGAMSKKKAKKEFDSLITGYLLLSIMDFIIPMSFAGLHNMLTKKKEDVERIEMWEIQLDEKAFKKLEPLADAAASHLQLNVNPVVLFFVSSAIMYGGNFYALKQSK